MNALTRLRKRAGLTQADLAGRMNTSQQQVWRLENGTRRMTFDWAERIAAALDVAPADLLGPRAQITHVVGYVGAGAEVIPFDDHPQGGGMDAVICPQGLNPEKTVAVRVRGDSMAPLIQDGWLIFYSREPEADLPAVMGRTCVVKLVDGRVLLKQVRRGPVVGRVNLHSVNAPVIEDVAMEWASPVRVIMPPDLADATSDIPVDSGDGVEDDLLLVVRREVDAGLLRQSANVSETQRKEIVADIYQRMKASQTPGPRAASASKLIPKSPARPTPKHRATKRH